MLRQTLLALYHTNNRYAVHLDVESSPEERLELHEFMKNHPVFVKFANVVIFTNVNLVTCHGWAYYGGEYASRGGDPVQRR